MQARDHLALVFARRHGVLEELINLYPYVFAILKVLEAGAGYASWLYVACLQYSYLKQCNHPVYLALMADHMMANENCGEASFSQLAASMGGDRNTCEYNHLRNSYRFLGASKGVRRKFEENQGAAKVGASHKHVDLEVAHHETIGVLREHLKELCNMLNNKLVHVFPVGAPDITKTKIGTNAEAELLSSLPVLFTRGTIAEFSLRKEETFAKKIKDNTYHDINILLA